MRKHGRTASGSQRWRCTACNLTTTAPRAVPPARTEQATLGEFIAWATSKGTQADQPGGARAFRRRTACRERTQVKQFFPRRFHIMPECARLFFHEGEACLFLCSIAPKDGRRGRNQITMRVP